MRLHKDTIAGSDISLNCYVAGEGPPLVMLHGHPDCGFGWIRQFEHFSDRFRMIAPDLRGCGLSGKAPQVRDYAMGNLVGDLAKVVDHYAGDRMDFIGHDWGGIVGWYYAAYHPERINRFISICAPHPAEYIRSFADPRQQQAARYMQRILATGIFDVGIDTFEKRFPEPDIRTAFSEAMKPTDFRAVANYYRAARLETGEFPLSGIPKVQAPSMTIYARNDPVVIEQAYVNTYRWVDGPLISVPLELRTHFPHQENAARINAAIADWLASETTA